MTSIWAGTRSARTSRPMDLLRPNIPPKKHPALIASGVSLLDIKQFNGLTIFSRNGSTIRHAEFNIKAGTNLILRNLKFDELWEWDEATKGDYDSNDWDFVTIGDGGGVTSGIWVDHCTFTKSYDGVLDIKKRRQRHHHLLERGRARGQPALEASCSVSSTISKPIAPATRCTTCCAAAIHAAADHRHRAAAEERPPDRVQQPRGPHHLHGHPASQSLQGPAGPHAAPARRRRARLQPVRRQFQRAHRERDARWHRGGQSRAGHGARTRPTTSASPRTLPSRPRAAPCRSRAASSSACSRRCGTTRPT